MNTNTGQIYSSLTNEGTDIQDAIDRGEPVVPVSTRVAKLMRAAQRMEQQEVRKRKTRKRNAIASLSRKRNQ